MNAIIYCRVSTKDQVEGTSLKSQKEACLDYAARNGFTVLQRFTEEGESAKYADRTELLKLIEFCRDRTHGVQVLIVWKIDRFARNVEDHFAVKQMLAKYGVTIQSVTEPIDTQPVGKLMETVLAGVAQFDNDIRSIRSLGGMQRRIEEGLYPWKPPLGYMSAAPGSRKTQPDLPDPERFPVIQDAWRRLLSGSAIKADIRRMFADSGLTTKRGAPVSAQLIDRIFRNKYYAGILRDPWSDKEYQGRHVPMVTPEEFALVRRNLNRKNRRLPHIRMREDFPLRSFLRCDGCGLPLTGSWSRGRNKKYAYYHCRSSNCSRYGKGIPTGNVYARFRDSLDRIGPKTYHVPALAKEIEETLNKRSEAQRRSAERSRFSLIRFTRENMKLIEMRQKELIGEDEFREAHRKLDRQIAARKASVAQYDSRAQIAISAITDTLRSLTRLRELWGHDGVAHSRAVPTRYLSHRNYSQHSWNRECGPSFFGF